VAQTIEIINPLSIKNAPSPLPTTATCLIQRRSKNSWQDATSYWMSLMIPA
jgi:hypothetical protein